MEEFVPPEGGWGYVITVAVALMFGATVVPLSAFGMIYGDFLKRLGDEASGTALVNGLFNTFVSIMGLGANVLISRYSCRKVGLAGALIFFAGSILNIFATELIHLMISFSIMQGIGFGLMIPASFTSFNTYFLKRRSSMMGLSQTIIGVMSILTPALFKELMEEYGFRGMLLVLSGINFNCVLAMVALHPVEWHSKKKEEEGRELMLYSKSETEVEPAVGENLKPNAEIIDKSKSLSSDCSKDGPNKANGRSFWHSIVDSLDLNLLKDPVYVNISVGLNLSFLTDLLFLFLLPLTLKNMGFDTADITLCLTIFLLSDVMCRVLQSLVNSYFQLRNRHLFLVGTLATALLRIAFILDVKSEIWIATLCGLIGFMRSPIQVALPLVLAEQYSQKQFTAAFGLYMVFGGFVNLILGSLVGYVSRSSGDKGTILFLAIVQLICSVSWLIEIAVLRIRKTRSNAEQISTSL